MIHLKNPIILKNKRHQQRGEFNEKNISTEQPQAEKNPWVCGENEYSGGQKRLETEEGERKKEADGLTPFPPFCARLKIFSAYRPESEEKFDGKRYH